jgi:Leucine-rich repeat (LRR) protein
MRQEQEFLDDFVEHICPSELEITYEEDETYLHMLDAEWDRFKVSFSGDGCAKIETPNLTHLYLSANQLRILADKIDEAEKGLDSRK